MCGIIITLNYDLQTKKKLTVVYPSAKKIAKDIFLKHKRYKFLFEKKCDLYVCTDVYETQFLC